MSEGFVLAAGGTGGHLYPAEALARELIARGFGVDLATDRKSAPFAERLPGVTVHLLSSAPVAGGPSGVARGMFALACGAFEAQRLLRRLLPRAVIGFGGYPAVAPMLAAFFLRLPTVIHEQNAVLGRANRLLAPRVWRIATAFSETVGFKERDRLRAVCTGNPVRPEVLLECGKDYVRPQAQGAIELLILGGSQGARVLSEIVPPALSGFPEALRKALRVSHQARPEDRTSALEHYRRSAIAAEVESFFEDAPARLARAHLVICRAGASTIAELAAIGRPALLIPYPYATDDHQTANARAFEKAGGGWVLLQSELDPERLRKLLLERIGDPRALAQAALSARRFGRRDAAQRLADLAVDCAGAWREGRAA